MDVSFGVVLLLLLLLSITLLGSERTIQEFRQAGSHFFDACRQLLLSILPLCWMLFQLCNSALHVFKVPYHIFLFCCHLFLALIHYQEAKDLQRIGEYHSCEEHFHEAQQHPFEGVRQLCIAGFYLPRALYHFLDGLDWLFEAFSQLLKASLSAFLTIQHILRTIICALKDLVWHFQKLILLLDKEAGRSCEDNWQKSTRQAKPEWKMFTKK
ncbi:uncharacterized protein LOC120539022 [Polypterus senegalus]|uniref:uncharacterized protein LOC120539022 n=1 Tax=Polypterus senegalus TaxID=55291 RepID=UPI001962F6B5|nr:uncharacterized protein LOC120539022 [Polypterus senegalus]